LTEDAAALFDSYRAPLLRHVSALGLPAADGEDVVQEVFLALIAHLQAGKDRANLRGWIFRVGHNLALKKRALSARQVADLPETADPAPGPEELVALRTRYGRVRAIVAALPARDRACLSLRAEGLRYREIAEALDMSLGSVAASLSRSLERLSRA